jgi:hypothetical protein
MSPDIPIYVLEASTDKKLSRHVILEVFLENIPTVKSFVEHVIEKTPCEYVDLKVYTRNRLFRLIHSYKCGKPKNSALRLPGVDGYDPIHVFKTMIQAMLPPHYAGPFDKIKDEVATSVTYIAIRSAVSSGSTRNGYSGCHGTAGVPDSLSGFITSFSAGGVVLSCKENDSFISCIVGDKQCPWKQDTHKHNNQYFTIIKSVMRGYFQCADPECTMTPYGHVDVSCLWRLDNIRKNRESN